jgi:hypothetical protein
MFLGMRTTREQLKPEIKREERIVELAITVLADAAGSPPRDGTHRTAVLLACNVLARFASRDQLRAFLDEHARECPTKNDERRRTALMLGHSNFIAREARAALAARPALGRR